MSTLAEIEMATDELSAEQKQELLVYLITRLRADGKLLPNPRAFTSEQISEWIKDDEADLNRFNGNK